MARLARGDEVIVGAVEHIHHVAEFWGIAICQLGRGDALGAGRLKHLDAVLVRAGQEKDIHALQTPKPRERVRGHRLVGVANMGRIVRIRDGSGDVIGPLLSHGADISLAAAPGKRAQQLL